MLDLIAFIVVMVGMVLVSMAISSIAAWLDFWSTFGW